jgi:hypothetical protein
MHMAPKHNYLLGKGENLARNEIVKLGFGEGREPYSFGEQKAYLAPQAVAASNSLSALPLAACPHDEAVAILTLHPKYLSKSAYPSELLKSVGLRAVGSKGITITPRKTHLQEPPSPSASAELFVAGPRDNFRRFSQSIKQWSMASPGAADLLKIESLRVALADERVKPIRSHAKELLFEVILHAGESRSSRYILEAFAAYVAVFQIKIDLAARIDADELSFVPVRTSPEKIRNVAEFSFLRTAREMSQLRELWPVNSGKAPKGKPVPYTLPKANAADPTIRVAVFDGGQPEILEMSRWVRRLDAPGVLGPVERYYRHGLAVNSALLFDSLQAGVTAPIPYAQIDHYRVLDEKSATEPQDSLYPILKRIVAVLKKEKYDFVNFSVGPSTPIEDDDIHPWTATIDPLLSSGLTLATVAAGNGGELDSATRLNRIQPPADCVNALSVGACDAVGDPWRRAAYSSVGHGRCPGIMKPDGMAFGGVSQAPFLVVGPDDTAFAVPVTGTSFASPAALRAAIGVRAHLGPALNGLALKALLIHNCRVNGHEASEVGWGQFCTDVEALVTCATGSAHVVYQGKLDPKKFLRARIPMPKAPINSLVTIKATLCVATKTDPQHPLTYTRSGLQIFFRKDRANIPPNKVNPKPSGFFKSGIGMPEQLIRNDAHQWETVRHQSKRMRGRDLIDPCFDIHLNPREEGHDTAGEELPYAMIVTVSAPKVKDLFEQVFERYRFQLQELRPQLQLPIRIK